MKILIRVVLLSAIANGGIVLGVETEPVMDFEEVRDYHVGQVVLHSTQ